VLNECELAAPEPGKSELLIKPTDALDGVAERAGGSRDGGLVVTAAGMRPLADDECDMSCSGEGGLVVTTAGMRPLPDDT
jgi:hypothetical protein